MGTLSHVRVLDLTRVLAGPWASQMLGDLGADVIKIERPAGGDDTRSWGPPWMNDPCWEGQQQSAYFVGANRNKRSLAVDLRTPEGQDIVRRLVAQSDVVLENFKVGDLKRYGLDYETLSGVNPALIYCSVTGFGQSGPYAHRPGYDLLVQAMGGLMSITGHPDDQHGGGPVKVGVAVTDLLTGLYATVGILAALAERTLSGKGQYVDVALLDVQVAMLANQAMNYLATGEQPARYGNAHPNIVPYQDFPTADGRVIVAVGNDRQFVRLCEALGEPQWAADPRFRTNTDRIEYRYELVGLISERMRTQPSAHWIELLEACDVLCGPINGMQEVFEHPQVLHRGMKVAVPGSEDPSTVMLGNPLKLSRTEVEYRMAPPALGAHSREILAQRLGMTQEDIDRLVSQQVIAQ